MGSNSDTTFSSEIERLLFKNYYLRPKRDIAYYPQPVKSLKREEQDKSLKVPDESITQSVSLVTNFQESAVVSPTEICEGEGAARGESIMTLFKEDMIRRLENLRDEKLRLNKDVIRNSSVEASSTMTDQEKLKAKIALSEFGVGYEALKNYYWKQT